MRHPVHRWSIDLALVSALALLQGACQGTPGPTGPSVLLATSAEPAGEHCPAGGRRVDYGLDADADGQLGPGEATDALYVCDGAAGAPGDPGASVTVVAEDPGDHCPAGGLTVRVGEGAATYVCHGVAGQSVTVTAEPGGAHCAAGGVALQVGDAGASYVCNGVDGQSVAVTTVGPGAACAHGGAALQVGGGAPTYVCNGAPGAPAPCAGNHAPVVTGVDLPAGTLYAGEPVALAVQATDQDGDALAYAVSGPGGALTDQGGGAFTLLPVAGGPYAFSVLVTDGCQLALGSFQLGAVRPGWTAVGAPGFAAAPQDVDVAALGGAPFAAVSTADGHAELWRFDGAEWVPAGPPPASGVAMGLQLTYTAVAKHAGDLYWAASDGSAWRLGAAGWTALQPYAPQSSGPVRLVSDGADLYLGYLHHEEGAWTYNWRIGVKKLDPSTGAWQPVGYAGAAGIGAWAWGGYLEFDLFAEAGVPYVLFTDASGPDAGETHERFTVQRYAGGAWSGVGAPEAGPATFNDHLAVIDGVVYVSTWQAGVWQCSGGSWTSLPYVRVGGEADVAVRGGQLHLLAEGPAARGVVVQRWDGAAWSPVATASAGLPGPVLQGSLALEGDRFFVAFGDPGAAGALSVLQLELP